MYTLHCLSRSSSSLAVPRTSQRALYFVAVLTLCASTFAQSTRKTVLLFEAHPIPSASATTVATPYQTAAPFLRQSFIASTPAELQPTTDLDALKATVTQYQAQLESLKSDTTPFNASMLEPLLSISDAYRDQGEFEAAQQSLEQAQYISRINEGLNSPQQQLISEKLIANYLAQGNYPDAINEQQDLLRRNMTQNGGWHPSQIPMLIQLGDWSRAAFERDVHGTRSIGIVLGNTRGQRPQSPREMAIARLDQANLRYVQAIEMLLNRPRSNLVELLALEEKLLQGIYLSGHRRGLQKNPDFYFGGRIDMTGHRISRPEFTSNSGVFLYGLDALNRMHTYLENGIPANPLALLHVKLHRADWYTLFRRRKDAAELYAQAYAFAQSQSDPQPFLALFNPSLPLQLPLFMPLPHSRSTLGIADSEPVNFTGYFDVQFSRSALGDVKELELIGQSANVSDATKRRLWSLLTKAPFRPQLVNGQPVTAEPLRLRYYFSELARE